MTDYNRANRPAPPRAPQGNRPAQPRTPQQGRPATPAPPAAPARPAKPKKAPLGPPYGKLPKGFVPLVIVCAAILALGLALQSAMPGGFALKARKIAVENQPVRISEIHGDGPIRLNEIMTANGGVMVDASGATPDWVEVANVGNRPVNLKGYVLARSAKAGNVFVFPDAILQPGECAVVYADGTLQAELGEELHAPFRLSSTGDVLMLFNAADVAVDTVNIPQLSDGEVYARADRDTWTVSAQTTPGLLNTEENYRVLTSVVQDSPIRMCEVVASNTKYAPDESGVFHDYVVLRNTSEGEVDIGGWYLSDKPKLPRLWRFPQGTSIPGGGTLLVYCSGLNRVENTSRLHTSFKLSTEGETLTLSNAKGQPVDTVTYDLLRTDTAYLRADDGSWSVGEATGKSGE